jgi:hypothetical protein
MRRREALRSLEVTTPDPFEQAGEAACLLEEMGFVAVARKRDGNVQLELWRAVGQERRVMRYVIEAAFDSARELADHCVTRFQTAI